jgi:hypothetical protein
VEGWRAVEVEQLFKRVGVLVAFGQVLMGGALAAVIIAVPVPVIVWVICDTQEAAFD